MRFFEFFRRRAAPVEVASATEAGALTVRDMTAEEAAFYFGEGQNGVFVEEGSRIVAWFAWKQEGPSTMWLHSLWNDPDRTAGAAVLWQHGRAKARELGLTPRFYVSAENPWLLRLVRRGRVRIVGYEVEMKLWEAS